MNASFTARELWQFCQIIFREYLVEINFILCYGFRCYRKEEHNYKYFSYPCELFIVLLFKYIDKSSYCLFSILFFHVGIPNVRNMNDLTVFRSTYLLRIALAVLPWAMMQLGFINSISFWRISWYFRVSVFRMPLLSVVNSLLQSVI